MTGLVGGTIGAVIAVVALHLYGRRWIDRRATAKATEERRIAHNRDQWM